LTRGRRFWLGLLLSLTCWGCASEPPRFVYVISGSAVSAYGIDPKTGALTPVPGSPVPLAGNVYGGAAVTPSGRFLYIGRRGAGPRAAGTPAALGSVAAYAIGPTGALTPVPGSPFPAEGDVRAITLSPAGRFLYAVSIKWTLNNRVMTARHGVSVYLVGEATGALTPVPGAPPEEVQAFAIEPSGRFAYAIHHGYFLHKEDQVLAYGLDATTGALRPTIPGSPFSAGWQPEKLVVAPSGRLLYVLHANWSPPPGAGAEQTNISAYTIDATSGALAPVPLEPVGSASRSRSLALAPSGRFAYVADQDTPPVPIGGVWAYRVDETTGALTPVAGSPVRTAARATAATVDSSGHYLYVTNIGPDPDAAGSVSAYRIDATTGALTPVPGSPFAAAPAPAAVITTGPRK
jgi:6-phosphogluconolactonase (cycloisomerase 2 family)